MGGPVNQNFTVLLQLKSLPINLTGVRLAYLRLESQVLIGPSQVLPLLHRQDFVYGLLARHVYVEVLVDDVKVSRGNHHDLLVDLACLSHALHGQIPTFLS